MHTVSLRGARTHNLRGIDLDLDLSDHGSVVVVAGVAGAGKSSLALDTLYAEGQRRYVESFSAYARQFLERLPRPPVDRLEPVPAAIAVDRAAPVRTSRSTVGTMTEVADYVRSLYATAARLHCPRCARPVERDDASAAARRVNEEHGAARVTVVYRLPVADVESFLGVRESLLAAGYRRVLVHGETVDLDRVAPSDVLPAIAAKAKTKAKTKTKTSGSLSPNGERVGVRGERPQSGELVVVADRTTASAQDRSRLAEAIEAAMKHGDGRAEVHVEGGAVARFSNGLHCAYCDTAFRASSAGLFSFNSPVGACPTCRGFGRTIEVDWDRVVPDHSLPIARGAIRPWSGKSTEWERGELAKVCKRARIPTDVAWRALTDEQRRLVLFGEPGADWERGEWPGVAGWFSWMEQRTYKMHVRVLLSRYRRYETCRACSGGRLRPEALWWRIDGLSMAELLAMPAGRAADTVERWQRDDVSGVATHPLARTLAVELGARLSYLRSVGLGYVTLDRSSRTLSGGESQRASLASALGATLTGALVVLDEPTVGLHPVDVRLLVSAVRDLANAGNLVVVVENDAAVIESADRVIELGPGAGADGGTIVFDGRPDRLPSQRTPTGDALSGRTRPHRAGGVRTSPSGGAWISLRGARGNNLRGVDARFARGGLTIVTGQSGSGKSSLVGDTLYPAVARALGQTTESSALPFDALDGIDGLAGVVLVDQSPLGRTSRGNAGTYLKLLDELRVRFAAEPEAIRRGLVASAFSFNVEGGRCEACRGEGFETVEMQLLADVSFPCVVCGGRRFKDEVLAVRHRGVTMGEILDMTAAQVGAWLREGLNAKRAASPRRSDRALDRLQLLLDVGLGYLPLGQPLNTLSGGEAQRLKLAATIGAATPGSLVILDEPSVGLHPLDVNALVNALDALVQRGDTVVAVEHDLSIAACADHIIDLGPGGGDAGGEIVVQGDPAAIVASARSTTGPFLREVLAGVAPSPRPSPRSGRGGLTSSNALTSAAGGREPSAVSSPSPSGRGGRGVRSEEPRPIRVERATEHNLRAVSVDIPREKLVVVTGPSGSGKSTLAFDVVYAEGQRRYLQTLSPYARQYLPQLPRPAVDRVVGVPPTISLEQRTAGAGGRSTVATVTEVAHYLRLVWSRAGEQWCPDCDIPVVARDRDQMVESVVARFKPRSELKVSASVIRKRKGHHGPVLERAAREGITEAVIDGQLQTITGETRLERYALHDIDLIVGVVRAGDRDAVRAAVSRALDVGDGTVGVRCGDETLAMSSRRTCPTCLRAFPEPDPRLLSFNTKEGACSKCNGHGVVDADPAVAAKKERRRKRHEKQRGRVDESAERAPSMRSGKLVCAKCAGTRLSPVARAVKLGGLGVHEVLALPVELAAVALMQLDLTDRARIVGGAALAEAGTRLSFLRHVGLGYLSLDRAAASLSGGELQRLRLAAQLGSGLTGALYVLDEPTIGLHPRDTGKLLAALRRLVTAGSTVLVVEHDADSIRAADHLIDLGPGGGRGGGRIVYEGPPAGASDAKESATGRALAHLQQPSVPRVPRPVAPPPGALPARGQKAATRTARKGFASRPTTVATSGWTVLRGASEHNLRDVDVGFPTGRLVCVSGVSGSGKSTLVRSVLYPAARRALGLEAPAPGAHAGIEVDPAVRRVVEVDQSPIGRTPRSVPATYVGIWDDIRTLFAATPEARAHGWDAARFSFNVTGGRCESCSGQGATLAEMSFLPAVLVPCDGCGGSRFTDETRSVQLFGIDVSGVLALTASEAVQVFSSFPRIARPLQLMCDLGLGYLSIGQASNTLSGGEAQRIKIVTELAATATAGTLYVLDEPTTGLHLEDVSRLVDVLQRMVDRGDTIVVIEHHPDVIAAADWVIDLGPEGGGGGGTVVVAGAPSDVAACAASHTGAVLRESANRSPPRGKRSTSTKRRGSPVVTDGPDA